MGGFSTSTQLTAYDKGLSACIHGQRQEITFEELESAVVSRVTGKTGNVSGTGGPFPGSRRPRWASLTVVSISVVSISQVTTPASQKDGNNGVRA